MMNVIKKYKTKDGTTKYYFYISTGINPKNGKKSNTTRRGFRTEKEARAAFNALWDEVHKGKFVAKTTITVEDYIKQWLKEYEQSGVKKSTIQNRKTTSLPHIRRLLGKLKLSQIDIRTVKNMIATLREEGYSDNTVGSIHITLNLILRSAIEDGYLKEAPIIKIPKKRQLMTELTEEDISAQFLQKDELKHFLSVVKEKGTLLQYSTFLTLAYCGCRIGELTSLKYSDIDFDRKTIRINKTLYREKNTIKDFEITPPKSRKANRTIHISQTVLDVIQELRFQQIQLKERYKHYTDFDFVFAIDSGEYIGYPNLRRRIGEWLKHFMRLSGISKPMTIHKFRNVHISLLAEAGVSLPTIQDRIGHLDSRTTLKHYLYVTQNTKQDTAEKFDRLMND